MTNQDSNKGLNWEKAVFYAEEGKPRQAEKYLRVADADDKDSFFLMVNAYRNRERFYRDKARECARAGDPSLTENYLDRTHLEPEEAFNILIGAYRETETDEIDNIVWEDIELAAEEEAVFTAENLMDHYNLAGEEYFKQMIHAYRNRFDAKEKAEYMAEKGMIDEAQDYLENTELDDWEAIKIMIKAHRQYQQ